MASHLGAPDLNERVRLALEMIPTCDRCKRLRRKCDIDLPACRPCKAANQKCEFKDQVLQETIPRSQVKDLLDRWSALRKEEDAALLASISTPVPRSIQEHSLWETSPVVQRLNFDAHFPVPTSAITPTLDHSNSDGDGDGNAGSGFVFFGASSAQVLSTELLAAVCPQSPLLLQPPGLSTITTTFGYPDIDTESSSSSIAPTKALIHRLVDIYTKSCMVLWPFQPDSIDSESIDVFFQSTQEDIFGSSSQAYTRTEAQSIFQIAMISCIACAHSSRMNVMMRAYEQFFYNFATKLIKEVLSEASHASLRSLLLVIVYLLFRPQRGDLWLQLQSACRLAIELGYHREDAIYFETPEQKSLRSRTFWTLYRLEHIVAERYGRPSDDLESISTIDLPHWRLSSSTADHLMSPVLQTSLPPSTTATDDLASSLARLSRIRSYIFKTIYLPAREAPLAITFSDPYYRVQLREIEQWCHDATAKAGATDPLASLACTVAYHASVIFLFQKSLLLVLAKLASYPDNDRGSGSSQKMVGPVAVQSFSSAMELINCYETLILSGKLSSLANFPVTFISAQDIYAAALTFLACCFCFLDGRVKPEDLGAAEGHSLVQQPWLPLDGNLLRKGEGRRLHHVATSCLSLLTWCAMQWPGMDGMVEIYREVFAEIFQRMAAQGLA